MINLQRGARELALEQRTRDFIKNVIIPFERDPRLTSHGPSAELVTQLRELARSAGLLAPQAPERWGGLGLSHREIATVFRASGYSLLGPVAMNCMAPDEGNMHLLDKVATPEQQQRFLAPLVAGECRSAFLMTEPDGGAGSDPQMLKTTATRQGNGWSINGRKWLITGAPGAAFAIIMARTEGGATMFLADMNTPGIVVERVLNTIDASMPGGHAIVQLNDVRVDDASILGKVDEGFRYAQIRLAPARLTHCMRWWGAAQRAHDIATEYACTRQAFGKPLIEHEGVGFMLARNACDLKQAELVIDHCAWVLDQGHKASTESSMAKYTCAELLFGIADRCVQILGGTGVTDETPVAAIFKEIRAFRIYDGPSEVHLFSLARRIASDWRKRAG
jgi:acyl-CoA dehydrogenase